MATIRANMETLIAENPGRSVAAFLSGAIPPTKDRKPTLHYHVSSPLVPAATALYARSKRSSVYTDLPAKHWLLTYMDQDTVLLNATGKSAKRYESLDWEIAGVSLLNANTEFVGHYAPSDSGPIAMGGLAAVARAVAGRASVPGAFAADSREAALERALRYYQLAAFGLIGRARHVGLMIGHYVGALMVNDKGGIVGWGINSNKGRNDFHHAEVNMMLAYFQTAQSAKLPANCIVFSSLTPCEQCGALLSSALGDSNCVFYGQMDTGTTGRKGAAMSASTDALACKAVAVHPKGRGRMPVSSTLAGCIPEGASIASALKKSTDAENVLKDASGDFERRLNKRTDEATKAKFEERKKTAAGQMIEDIKTGVLAHIKASLESINV